MNFDTKLWSALVEFDRKLDVLIEKVRERVRPTPALGRELLTVASVEVQWLNVGTKYIVGTNPALGAVPVNSDQNNGNNVKTGIFTNGSARLLLREVCFNPFVFSARSGTEGENFRRPVALEEYYFRWNLQTSITQRHYADKMVSCLALGSPESGSHLVFREPFVLEPMETLIVTCELLKFGIATDFQGATVITNFGVNFDFFGYREGV